MTISILTATYNRGQYLAKLYKSILDNSDYGVNLEWLIMDDGSNDETKVVVDTFINETINNKNIIIKYYYQKNQGKMVALNNLIKYADSDLLMECDSDDYLCNNAIKTIFSKYNLIKDRNNIYALVFLKHNENSHNIGSKFKENNYVSNMFNLYFKDGILGDKTLVYITKIRKQYKYILEKNERFSTEARLHNEMDKKYNVICFNEPVMICKYLKEGYSNNIKQIFKENPYGYYEYFKQLLNFNMQGVLFNKRIYMVKHYILFSYLIKQKNILKNVQGKLNKALIIALYIPGVIKSWIYMRND